MDSVDRVEEKITALTLEARQFETLAEWMHVLGEFKGAEQNDFDDSSWKSAKISWDTQWQASEVNAWFRKKISLPEKVFGISLIGAKVEGFFFTPNGGQIFVDGKEAGSSETWLPDINFPIAVALGPKRDFTLAVKINKGAGWGVTFFSRIFIDRLDEALFEIEVFQNVLKIAQQLIKWKPSLKKQYEKMIEDSISLLNIKALDEKNIPVFLVSMRKAYKLLSPVSKEAKKMTIHLAGHAHIDMNWLWTWPSTLSTTKNTFQTVDKLMGLVPEFRFSQSQAGLYKAVEDNYPELFKTIQKRVKEGKWEITASTWVECDLNTTAGESLVRQTLYAKKYIMEKFGVEPKICWCPDTFGHPWTYPQILKKSGIDFYYGHRCRPKKEYPLFWWEGPEGSKVLAFMTDCYSTSIRPGIGAGYSTIPINVMGMTNYRNKTGSNNYLIIHGVGDHGGGPTLRDLKRGKRLQKINEFPEVKFTGTEGYYETILKEKPKLPVCKDELNFTCEGCYTTHGDIKMYNRISENILQASETANAVASALSKNEYPSKNIEKAWQDTCFNQFHDIYCGSAIHPCYGEGEYHAKTIFDNTMKIASNISDDALKALSARISYSGKGTAVTVFNSFSWKRKDVVIIDPSPGVEINKDLCVYDEKGNAVFSQYNGKQIIFEAEVPATGYRVYYLRKGNEKFESLAAKEEGNSILTENEFFSVAIDKNSGALTKFFHKPTAKKMFIDFGDVFEYIKSFLEPGNLFQVHDEKPFQMRAWLIGPISKTENLLSGAKVEIVEQGPVRVVIRVRHKVLSSFISQDIVIYRNIPRIDFFTNVDWNEKGNQTDGGPMLTVSFPMNFTSDKACFEIPFGYIYRQTNGQEVPQLKWMDLSVKGQGLSLLNNAKYGVSVQGNKIKLTLIRSSYDPDPVSDVGKHTFSYSLYPHKGDWRAAGTVRAANEFNQPFLISVNPSDNVLRTTEDGHNLPESMSFLSIEPSNIVISALKQAEDNNGMILRFYEANGKKTNAKINLNKSVKNAFETDLIERNLKNGKLKIQGNKLNIPVGKHEIKTIRLLM